MTTPIYSEHKPKRLPLWSSHAHRWMNCPGQPRVTLAAKVAYGDDQSEYAAEGTWAHLWLEKRLTGHAAPPDPEGVDNIEEQKALLEEVAQEIEFIAQIGGYEIHVEQRLELRIGRHLASCRIDITLVNKEHVLIIDYKHGAGRKVAIQNNPQLMMYAIAAAAKYPGRAVSIGIYQPRGNGEGLIELSLRPEELLAWREAFEAAVARCYAHRAEYVMGPWCWGCACTVCPAHLAAEVDAIAEIPGTTAFAEQLKNREEEVKDEVKEENKANGIKGKEAAKIKDERVSAALKEVHRARLDPPWWLLDVAERVVKMCTELGETADAWLEKGKPVPGWSLQYKTGNRKWTTPDEVPALLAERLGGTVDDWQHVKITPVGIGDAEKEAKKQKKDLGDMMSQHATQKRVRDNAPSYDELFENEEYDEF